MLLAPLLMVPLEIQRRIVDDVLPNGSMNALFWLCAGYLCVVLFPGAFNLEVSISRVAAINAMRPRKTVPGNSQ